MVVKQGCVRVPNPLPSTFMVVLCYRDSVRTRILSLSTFRPRLNVIGEQTKELQLFATGSMLILAVWMELMPSLPYRLNRTKQLASVLPERCMVSNGMIRRVVWRSYLRDEEGRKQIMHAARMRKNSTQMWQGCQKAAFMATRVFFMNFCREVYFSSLQCSEIPAVHEQAVYITSGLPISFYTASEPWSSFPCQLYL